MPRNYLSKTQEATIRINRRKLVAEFYLKGMNQQSIAVALQKKGYDCVQSTVSRDLDAIRIEWKEEYKQNMEDHVNAELCKLDNLELDANIMLNRAKKDKNTKDTLKIMATLMDIGNRRARLLGLYKPEKLEMKTEHTGQVVVNLIRASCKEPISQESLDIAEKSYLISQKELKTTKKE